MVYAHCHGELSHWGDFVLLFFDFSQWAVLDPAIVLSLQRIVQYCSSCKGLLCSKRKLAGGWYLTMAHNSSLAYKYSYMSFIGIELFYQTRSTNVSFKIRTLYACIHRHTCVSVFVGGVGIPSRALLMIVKYFINELPPNPVQCFEYLSLLYVWYFPSQ